MGPQIEKSFEKKSPKKVDARKIAIEILSKNMLRASTFYQQKKLMHARLLWKSWQKQVRASTFWFLEGGLPEQALRSKVQIQWLLMQAPPIKRALRQRSIRAICDLRDWNDLNDRNDLKIQKVDSRTCFLSRFQ